MKIEHRGKIVTVSGTVAPNNQVDAVYTPTPGAHDGVLPVDGVVTFIPGPPTDFDTMLGQAHHILSHYRRSEPGSTWGCDGIGYIAQKKTGQVRVNMSGVGPRKFQQGEQARLACSTCTGGHRQ